jgi:hypothetical protein
MARILGPRLLARQNFSAWLIDNPASIPAPVSGPAWPGAQGELMSSISVLVYTSLCSTADTPGYKTKILRCDEQSLTVPLCHNAEFIRLKHAYMSTLLVSRACMPETVALIYSSACRLLAGFRSIHRPGHSPLLIICTRFCSRQASLVYLNQELAFILCILCVSSPPCTVTTYTLSLRSERR